MKTLNLIAVLLLVSTYSFAQFTVAKSDGTPINDGDIFTFTSNSYPDASLEYVVTNTTNQPINVVIEVVSISNTNGSGMELCFGSCYSGVTAHTNYPTDTPYQLAANASSESNGNHFLNTASNGSNTIEYVFKFKQLDMNGNEIGNTVTITYRYDPTAGVNDNFLTSFNLFPTIIKNNVLNIQTSENLDLTFVNIQGKTLKQTKVNTNTKSIDISNLNAGTYFVLIANKDGQEAYKKIILQ